MSFLESFQRRRNEPDNNRLGRANHDRHESPCRNAKHTGETMNLGRVGREWYLAHHGEPDWPIRVSRFYPSHESWKGPAWWFEFPPSRVANPRGWIILLCQRREDPKSFHCLRVPTGLFPACRPHLGWRKDKKIFSLFLCAEPENLFKEVRGPGGIQFEHFRCDE